MKIQEHDSLFEARAVWISATSSDMMPSGYTYLTRADQTLAWWFQDFGGVGELDVLKYDRHYIFSSRRVNEISNG